jgi:TetR/AcrR family transcriptional repressor of nem operon
MAKPTTREKLLSAGLETLHKWGFNATGVQDITDAAKVPKGSFYNHFESKDALGVEVVARWAAMASARRQPLVDGSGPPLARLRTHFKALNQQGPATGFSRGCLLGNFSTELS